MSSIRTFNRAHTSSGFQKTINVLADTTSDRFEPPEYEIPRYTGLIAIPGDGGTIKVELWFGHPDNVDNIPEDEWVPWTEGVDGEVSEKTVSVLSIPATSLRVTTTIAAGKLMVRG